MKNTTKILMATILLGSVFGTYASEYHHSLDAYAKLTEQEKKEFGVRLIDRKSELEIDRKNQEACRKLSIQERDAFGLEANDNENEHFWRQPTKALMKRLIEDKPIEVANLLPENMVTLVLPELVRCCFNEAYLDQDLPLDGIEVLKIRIKQLTPEQTVAIKGVLEKINIAGAILLQQQYYWDQIAEHIWGIIETTMPPPVLKGQILIPIAEGVEEGIQSLAKTVQLIVNAKIGHQ